ncbi:MAG: 2-C-methyl-D-erythritol 4-phosphate cytidylyltransferase [Coriobacteriia bacterium]|nr:2-C-methyl-D-erythritol 4-phosphate cytidylyltransferase [Coriobacteriia bacterium]
MPRSAQPFGAVVVAGGSGERFGAPGGKQLAPVGGRPLLARTLEALSSAEGLRHLVVVTHPDRTEEYRDALRADGVLDLSGAVEVVLVPGGVRRQDSVAAGLAVLPPETPVIAVHDGARPAVDPGLLTRAVDRLSEDAGLDGVVVGHPAYDTMKVVDGLTVDSTADRSRLWHAQTPQVFRAEALRGAYHRAVREGVEATDDAALVEAAGGRVEMILGPRHNLKVTVPEDLALVEALLGERGPGLGLRIGIGYDLHALVEGRPLVIGGVPVPFEMGLAGHSDADVLAHALMDGILGAMRAGDIGAHFPETDRAFAGISSLELLGRVGEMMAEGGFELLDADCVVMLERPRISPYRDAMRVAMADVLGVGAARIGVKATTMEGLGSIGRGEAAAAEAVVLLRARGR